MKETWAQELRIVHSSVGRLRVYCPDPGGHVVVRLRRLPGVTSASASELTGNILILFDPQLTSPEILCGEICSTSSEPTALLPTTATSSLTVPPLRTQLSFLLHLHNCPVRFCYTFSIATLGFNEFARHGPRSASAYARERKRVGG